MSCKLIVLIIILIILCIILQIITSEKFCNCEKFEKEELKEKTYSKNNVSYVDIQKQFPELVIFENDKDFRMGLDKCYEHKMKNNNKGNCVEYGLTGDAWYFPEVKIEYKNLQSNQDKDFTPNDIDERNIDEPNQTKLDFVFR